MKKSIKKINSNKPPEELEYFLEIMKSVDQRHLFLGVKTVLNGFTDQVKEEEDSAAYYNNRKSGDYTSFEQYALEKAEIKTWKFFLKQSRLWKYEHIIDLLVKPLPAENGYNERFWLEVLSHFSDKVVTLHSIAYLQSAMLKGDFEEEQMVWELYNEKGEIIQSNFIVPFFVSVEHVITKEGRLKPADSLIASLYDIDITRLRLCKICERLFWAYRANQIYCSRKCSNVFWQREYLSDPKNREQISEKRKANYAYQKLKKDKK